MPTIFGKRDVRKGQPVRKRSADGRFVKKNDNKTKKKPAVRKDLHAGLFKNLDPVKTVHQIYDKTIPANKGSEKDTRSELAVSFDMLHAELAKNHDAISQLGATISMLYDRLQPVILCEKACVVNVDPDTPDYDKGVSPVVDAVMFAHSKNIGNRYKIENLITDITNIIDGLSI